jgi:hypothetical protein
VVSPGLPEDLPPPRGAGAVVREGPESRAAVEACPLGGAAGDATPAGRRPDPVGGSVGHAPGRGRGRSRGHGRADGEVAAAGRAPHGGGPDAGLPPFRHHGTERRLERPQDPTEPTRGDRGKKQDHTVKHVRLIHAALTMRLLSETSPGSPHEQRMAERTPSPVPAGS